MTTELDIPQLEGTEAFTIGERIKVFFSELSLSVDKFNATHLNGSIHTVNPDKLFRTLKERNRYFKYANYQIPTPVFFNPRKTTFPAYVDFCLEAIDLLLYTNDELDTFYNAIKQTISSGTIPFSVLAKTEDKIINAKKTKLGMVIENTGYTHRALNQVYPNIAAIESTIANYNLKVKQLKSRDLEVTSKRVDNLIDLLKILKRKVDVGDVSLRSEEYDAITRTIAKANDMVTLLGSLMGMLNELSRCLQLQLDTLKTFADK